jgi:hypothetical protein
MFGLPSLYKLFVLVVIIMAVWYGFKFIGELDRLRKQALRRQGQGKARAPRAEGALQAEDMVKCRVCGIYMPSTGATSCGKPNCPY